MQSIICSYARTPVAHAVGKSIWTEFKRPRFEPWLDLNLQKRVVRCPLPFLFWVFKDAHTQLRPLYPLSTFNAFMWQKNNTRLSTPAQLQCLHSGAWEPGNEATCCHYSPALTTQNSKRDIKGKSCEYQKNKTHSYTEVVRQSTIDNAK